jgi:hypothetical protein
MIAGPYEAKELPPLVATSQKVKVHLYASQIDLGVYYTPLQGQRPIYIFPPPREALYLWDVREARRQGAVQHMFWAAFGHVSYTPLVPLVGNVNAVGIYNLNGFILSLFLQTGACSLYRQVPVKGPRGRVYGLAAVFA